MADKEAFNEIRKASNAVSAAGMPSASDVAAATHNAAPSADTHPTHNAAQDEANKSHDALVVEHITVRRGRLSMLVRVMPGYPHSTNKFLANRLLTLRPTLAQHTCVNNFGQTFGAVIDKTSLPHVLEHVIIDEQVCDPNSLTDITYVGTTEWTDETLGRARIEVNFADDLIVLRAIQRALNFLNNMVVW